MKEYQQSASLLLVLLLALVATGTAFKLYLAEPLKNLNDYHWPAQHNQEQDCMDECYRRGSSDHCYDQCTQMTRQSSIPTVKRQLMPLQSCLEAKCLGVSKKNYVNCMMQNCIYAKGLKGKRSWYGEDRKCINYHCAGLNPNSLEYRACSFFRCGTRQ